MINLDKIFKDEIAESVQVTGSVIVAAILVEMDLFNKQIGDDKSDPKDEYIRLLLKYNGKMSLVLKSAFPWMNSKIGGDFWADVFRMFEDIENN